MALLEGFDFGFEFLQLKVRTLTDGGLSRPSRDALLAVRDVLEPVLSDPPLVVASRQIHLQRQEPNCQLKSNSQHSFVQLTNTLSQSGSEMS